MTDRNIEDIIYDYDLECSENLLGRSAEIFMSNQLRRYHTRISNYWQKVYKLKEHISKLRDLEESRQKVIMESLKKYCRFGMDIDKLISQFATFEYIQI